MNIYFLCKYIHIIYIYIVYIIYKYKFQIILFKLCYRQTNNVNETVTIVSLPHNNNFLVDENPVNKKWPIFRLLFKNPIQPNNKM